MNSFQLLKLINDILDFSDFENDNITFNIRTHDAVKLCNEVVETVMASRKLEVEMRFDTDLSVLMLDTDDARLRQVLINLLVNAAKFTEQATHRAGTEDGRCRYGTFLRDGYRMRHSTGEAALDF